MPRYKVYGANRDTGEDTTITVEAATPGEAEVIANHRRVVVARVVELETLVEPPTPMPDARTKQGKPVCQACGGSMKAQTRSTGNCGGIALALIVLVVGIVVTVVIPVVGWVLGPLICLCALFMGGKRERIWKCVKCGAFVLRA